MSEMSNKALALRDAIRVASDALAVALIAADELVDALEGTQRLDAPATDVERRQVAALRRLLGQPHLDGVALTQGQAAHEIAYWTAEAERRRATDDQIRELGEIVASLALDGIAFRVPEQLSVAGWVREKRRLKALAGEAPASAGK